MAEENGRGDEEYEEFLKTVYGHPKTARNPKGAGRLSDEQRLFREFIAYKAARKEGIIEPLGQLLRGDKDSSDRRDEGARKRDRKGLIQRIVSPFITEKKIKEMKIDVADEEINAIVGWTAPYVMPYVGLVVGSLLGITGWYIGEEIPATDNFSLEEWNKLPEAQKTTYFEHEIKDDEVKAKRLRMQILHTAEDIVKGIWSIFRKFMKSEYDITPAEKVWYSSLGVIGRIMIWRRRRRYRKEHGE